MIDNRQDIFGFYRVDGVKMYSQIEAVEISRLLNKPITWHFNDEVYSGFDWTKEPTESISELYRKRCEQLREKYDYLVLFYSGGADSDNIFNHFLNNDIKLDEIVTITDYDATQNKMSLMNAEITEIAIPKIQKAKEKQKHLLYTNIDTKKIIIDYYEKLELDGIYNQNWSFAPLSIVRQKIKSTQEHWNKMFSAGKKVAFIFGSDKPKVWFDEKLNFKFWFYCGGIPGAVGPLSQRLNVEHEFTELFYWSPDSPKIPIKQAHIIKNFVKRNGVEVFKKVPIQINGLIRQCPVGTFNLTHADNYLQNEDLNRLIYPYWYSIPYQGRSLSTIFLDKETWFTDKMNYEQSARNWKIIMKKVLDITKTDFTKQTFFNYAIHNSKIYNLGD